MATQQKENGKLAVLIPGMGAVATTFMAGVISARRGLAPPIGSLAEYGELDRDGTRIPIREAVPLPDLDDLVFGGWDIEDRSALQTARQAQVLKEADLEPIAEQLEQIRPMKGVFDQQYVRNLQGDHVKEGSSKMALAEALMEDIERFKKQNDCTRAVAIWCGSTEVHVPMEEVHLDLETFEEGLRKNHRAITPTMIYAYAHLRSGVPFVNGAPNRALDCPALIELARRQGVPVAGRDFKTGQTLMKTVIGPGLSARRLAVRGWYSTNILGNKDGAVLDDPGSFKTKEQSKLSVLDSIFPADTQPELYGDIDHKVRIDYYRPRRDNKEAWDNIDLSGWMDYPMQMKVDFLCRDSILAAPLVLDLAVFTDLASRAGAHGPQEWLSFYFKSPQPEDGHAPVHDLFTQRTMLLEELERLMDLPVVEDEKPRQASETEKHGVTAV